MEIVRITSNLQDILYNTFHCVYSSKIVKYFLNETNKIEKVNEFALISSQLTSCNNKRCTLFHQIIVILLLLNHLSNLIYETVKRKENYEGNNDNRAQLICLQKINFFYIAMLGIPKTSLFY